MPVGNNVIRDRHNVLIEERVLHGQARGLGDPKPYTKPEALSKGLN